MSNTPLSDVPLSRIDELIEAAGRITVAPGDEDELADIKGILEAEKEAREVAVHHSFRFYTFRGLRQAFLEVQTQHPDVPVADIKAVATEELEGLLDAEGVNLSLVLNGNLTEQ